MKILKFSEIIVKLLTTIIEENLYDQVLSRLYDFPTLEYHKIQIVKKFPIG